MFSRISTLSPVFASTSRARAYNVASRASDVQRRAAKAATIALSKPVNRQQSTTAKQEDAPITPEEPLTHYRVTLMRSALGLPSYARETLLALGLKKRTQRVYHPFNPATAGQILRVKELVKVENVPTSAVKTKYEERRERKPPKGFTVLGRQPMPWAVKDEEAVSRAAAVDGASATKGPQEELAEYMEEDVIVNVQPPPASLLSTSAPAESSRVRAFHTSAIAQSESPVAPTLPEPLTFHSTPEALQYLNSLTPDSIPRSSCTVTYSRSSGPGGQNVNKLNTKATLRMLLKPLPKWVPHWCEKGLRSSKEYAPSSNSIVIQSSTTRSQASNTEDCFRKLHALVDHHARAVLVPVPDEEKKKRVQSLMKKAAARRRSMKDHQKSKKASRRGD